MSASYMRKCAGKQRYETRDEAARKRAALCGSEGRSTQDVSVFRCDQCLGWHTGRTARTFKTRQRRPGKRPNKRLRGRV